MGSAKVIYTSKIITLIIIHVLPSMTIPLASSRPSTETSESHRALLADIAIVLWPAFAIDCNWIEMYFDSVIHIDMFLVIVIPSVECCGVISGYLSRPKEFLSEFCSDRVKYKHVLQNSQHYLLQAYHIQLEIMFWHYFVHIYFNSFMIGNLHFNTVQKRHTVMASLSTGDSNERSLI